MINYLAARESSVTIQSPKSMCTNDHPQHEPCDLCSSPIPCQPFPKMIHNPCSAQIEPISERSSSHDLHIRSSLSRKDERPFCEYRDLQQTTINQSINQWRVSQIIIVEDSTASTMMITYSIQLFLAHIEGLFIEYGMYRSLEFLPRIILKCLG